MIQQRTPFRPPKPPAGPRHALEHHPQRQQAIDAALAGETCRAIAAKLNPPVSHAGVARFIADVVRPAIRQAEAIKQATEAAILKAAPFVTPAVTVLPDVSDRSGTSVQVQSHIRDAKRDSLSDNVTRAILDADPATSSPSAKLAIASHEGRVRMLAERQELLHQAATAELGEARGDLRKSPKLLATLLSEARQHEQQAAQELGQWDAGGAPSVAIQIVIPAAAQPGNREPCIEIDTSGIRR
jgi:hypothetical protein